MPEPFGFLPVDKPLGMTSHAVVEAMRRSARLKRVGHGGTLDPLATGLLVLCIGAATRLCEYVMATHKRYLAKVRLGATTETDDAEGQLLAEQPIAHLTEADVARALAAFNGEIAQIPPMYSAIKRSGQKLYELARRGEVIERTPRRVWLQTRLLAYKAPYAEIAVECSHGTYIRGLARDLGAALGVGGFLAGLRRLASGAFEQMVAWQSLQSALADGTWQRYLVDERAALPHFPEIQLDAAQSQALRHGRAVRTALSAAEGSLARLYAESGAFLAIAAYQDGLWRPVKVFGQS
ncbi:MAG: tRNA pseudouridine(55) synthase TruB [Chloroflexota bacterium]|nr:MAG: tRNA pseudouridine(55) synthase TruB [Chloroflexota bacterium]